MSEDMQDNKHTDDSSVSSGEAAMEQVTEERVAKKKSGYLGRLLLVVILIGAGVAAWFYQAMWLPQAQQLWVSLMPVQEQVDPMAAPDLRGSETEQTSNESESAGYALLPAIKEEKPAEKPPAEEPPAEESPALVESPVDDTVKDVVNDVVMDDETPVINNSSVESAEPTPVAPAAVVPLAPKVQDKTVTASIEQARQAFWARDLVKAEYMYRELLEREPTAADAWGELGNIYYGQAKWQQAAEAYAEAATQLLEQGQYSQAMFLHYVVRGLDPVQAARIEAKLRAMQATPQS